MPFLFSVSRHRVGRNHGWWSASLAFYVLLLSIVELGGCSAVPCFLFRIIAAVEAARGGYGRRLVLTRRHSEHHNASFPALLSCAAVVVPPAAACSPAQQNYDALLLQLDRDRRAAVSDVFASSMQLEEEQRSEGGSGSRQEQHE